VAAHFVLASFFGKPTIPLSSLLMAAKGGRRHHVMLSCVGVKAVGCHVLEIRSLFCELGVFVELCIMPFRAFFDYLSSHCLKIY
jgi:hypothetical protein